MKTRTLIIAVLLATATSVPAALGILDATNRALAKMLVSTFFVEFKSGINESNYAFWGFHSATEVPEIDEDYVIPIEKISLSALRNYHVVDDFQTLIEVGPPEKSHILYPIFVRSNSRTNIRSSISFRQDTSKQEAGSVIHGQRKLIRELTTTLNTVPNSEVLAGKHSFVVSLPVFDMWFIGYLNKNTNLVLLSTRELRLGPIDIGQGQAITPAAMLQLSTASQQYNGEPN